MLKLLYTGNDRNIGSDGNMGNDGNTVILLCIIMGNDGNVSRICW